MADLPHKSTDLFAVKGRAVPACSALVVKRRAPGGSPQAPIEAAPQAPDDGQAKAEGNGSASVLSIDLRAALLSAPSPQPEPSPAPEPRPASGITVPPAPQTHGVAGPLIAAVVAISIAAGLFYVFGPQRRDVAPVADRPVADAPAPAPVASAPASGPQSTVPAAALGSPTADRPPEPETSAAEEAAATAGGDTAAKTAKGGRLPSFDVVRVERNGATVIAGRAAPYAELILLHNGDPIGKVKADWAGEWAFVADQPLPADQHKISILVNEPDAEITLPEGVEAPAQVGDVVNSGPR